MIPFKSHRSRLVTAVMSGLFPFLLIPVLAFAGVKYQIQYQVPGLQKQAAEESEDPALANLKFYVDYSLEKSPGSVVERVSGQSYPAPAGSVVLDAQGSYAQQHGVESGLPDITLDLRDSWRVELMMAPPYVVPTNQTGALLVLGGSQSLSNPIDLGIYRSGGDFSDGYIYQSVEPHSGSTAEGASWELLHGRYYRLQNIITEPLERVTWSPKEGFMSIEINGSLHARFPAESKDVLSGTYDVFKLVEWQNPDLYKFRSLKIFGHN
jgi:hypothetical protein